MKMWEYRSIQLDRDPDEHEKTLNDLGAQGFELIGFTDAKNMAVLNTIQRPLLFVFKREFPA